MNRLIHLRSANAPKEEDTETIDFRETVPEPKEGAEEPRRREKSLRLHLHPNQKLSRLYLLTCCAEVVGGNRHDPPP